MLGSTFLGPWPGSGDQAASVVASQLVSSALSTSSNILHPQPRCSIQTAAPNTLHNTLHLSLISDESPHMILSILKF